MMGYLGINVQPGTWEKFSRLLDIMTFIRVSKFKVVYRNFQHVLAVYDLVSVSRARAVV